LGLDRGQEVLKTYYDVKHTQEEDRFGKNSSYFSAGSKSKGEKDI